MGRSHVLLTSGSRAHHRLGPGQASINVLGTELMQWEEEQADVGQETVL